MTNFSWEANTIPILSSVIYDLIFMKYEIIYCIVTIYK